MRVRATVMAANARADKMGRDAMSVVDDTLKSMASTTRGLWMGPSCHA
jgi:hypothetical protein